MTVGGLHNDHVAVDDPIGHSAQEIEVIILPDDLHIAAPEQSGLRLGQRAAEGNAEFTCIISHNGDPP